MSYKYDVFLSYPHRFIRPWVLDILLEPFAWYVSEALGRQISIFTDAEGILPGDSWQERLQQGVAISRCLVAIWCPSYFQSEWCRRECAAMLDREKEEGFRTTANPNGLVLPLKAADGEHFPEFAKAIQYLDCSQFVKVGGAFKNSPRYLDFQDLLQLWAPKVAASITLAPDWKDSWLTHQVSDLPTVSPSPFSVPSMI